MNIDLADILEGEAKVDVNKDVSKKRKSIPVFQNFDPATSLKEDIINEDGYEDPYIVNGILTVALIDGIKKRTKRMSHLQRFTKWSRRY